MTTKIKENIEVKEAGVKTLEVLNKLESDMENLKKGFKAKITSIDSCNSSEVFGSDSKYEDRLGLKITLELTDGSKEWDEFFSVPDSPLGLLNSKCRISNFKRKYGQMPYVGMIVDVAVDDNGFLKVVL